MKILIVEDDPAGAKILEDILQSVGKCDTVIDGEEAVQAFKLAYEKQQPYDLILMDIMMPNVDGQEALKLIRETEKEKYKIYSNGVKVIMATALDDQVNVLKAFCEGGAASYLVKPITRNKLLGKLNEMGLM